MNSEFNIYSPGDIELLMSESGFSFKKKFGQNFLINEAVPERIAEASLKNAPNARGCLEIGPGIGSLTKKLVSLYDKTTAIEIDNGLKSILSKVFPSDSSEKLDIVFADALSLDLNRLVYEKTRLKTNVCANLPYSVTSDMIMHILENNDRYFGTELFFDSVTVMIQKEAAQRLCAAPGKPEYGAITASASYYAEIKKLFDVAPGNFMPRPKVMSTVISIMPRHHRPVSPRSLPLFFELIRASFSQRRKTFVNSASGYFGKRLPDGAIPAALGICGIEPNRRGETFSLNELSAISDELFRFYQVDIKE